MRIPKYWAKASHESAQCWAWSDTSVEDAHRSAAEKAQRIAERLNAGQDLERYPYGRDAIREWCIQEITDDAGAVCAAITRNGYGAYVLNAASLMMADVDLPEPRWSGGLLAGIFGRKRTESQDASVEQAQLALNQMLSARPEMGVRVYRTFAGLRYLFTHRTGKADDPQVLAMLRQLSTDPLYVKLCQSQACFRARLTPKPWRCGHYAAGLQFP